RHTRSKRDWSSDVCSSDLGMWTYLPFHLIDPPYELTLGQIAFFYLAYSFGIIGAPIAGWLTAKYTLRIVRVTGIFILSLGMIVEIGRASCRYSVEVRVLDG